MNDRVTTKIPTRTTGPDGPDVSTTDTTHWVDVRLVSAASRLIYQQSGIANVEYEIKFPGRVLNTKKGVEHYWVNKSRTLVQVGPSKDPDGSGRWTLLPVREAHSRAWP